MPTRPREGSCATFDSDGRPVEHGSHVYLADRYPFKMTLIAR